MLVETHGQIELDHDAGRRGVGADVGPGANAQRQRLAVGVERELGVAGDVAAVRGREEILAAVGLPAHRPPQRARRVGDDDVFRIGTGFHAEAAADVADEHPHLLQLEVRQGRGQAGGDRRRHLVADANDESTRWPHQRGDDAARLKRDRRDALVDDVDRDPDRGPRECSVSGRGIAVAHLGGDVVGPPRA